MFVAHLAATVFRGAGSFTLKTDWVFDFSVGLHDALEQHLVLPVVTHVVGVFENELFAVLRQDVAEQGLGRVLALWVVGGVNLAGDAVSVRPDIEIVEMAVGPPEGTLNVPMEIENKTILDLEAPPDRGLDLQQGDPELIDGLGGLRLGWCPRGGGLPLGLFGGWGHGGI